MITPEYIKGYIDALRTVQIVLDDSIEYHENDFQCPYEKDSVIDPLKQMLKFVTEQRKTYKEIVDKLNKENSNAG